MNKLVSVIVPVYNVEQYLEQCINSILGQTYKNLEIILVDDGSTDKSGIMCEQYALADNRVVVIHKENGGLSDARNVGMAIAKGDYIGFVDSDDYIHCDMYKVLTDLLEQNNADIAIANWCGFNDKEGEKIYEERTGNILTFEDLETLEFLIYGKNEYKISLSVWDRLYRREIIEEFRFPKGMCYEDVVWSTKVFYKAQKSVYIDRNLYYYRRRDSGIVGSDNNGGVSERVITDQISQTKAQIAFLKQIGQQDIADEVTYLLYELVLRYCSRCKKKEIYTRLTMVRQSFKQWAIQYIGKKISIKRKLVLFSSLYLYPVLEVLICIKAWRKSKFS